MGTITSFSLVEGHAVLRGEWTWVFWTQLLHYVWDSHKPITLFPLSMFWVYTRFPAFSPDKLIDQPNWGVVAFHPSRWLGAFSLQSREPSSASRHAYVAVLISFSSAAGFTAAWRGVGPDEKVIWRPSEHCVHGGEEVYIPEQKNHVYGRICTVRISDIYLFRIHARVIFLNYYCFEKVTQLGSIHCRKSLEISWYPNLIWEVKGLLYIRLFLEQWGYVPRNQQLKMKVIRTIFLLMGMLLLDLLIHQSGRDQGKGRWPPPRFPDLYKLPTISS